jgi:hypothetical protein
LPFSLVRALLVISLIREVSVTISLLVRTFNYYLSDQSGHFVVSNAIKLIMCHLLGGAISRRSLSFCMAF